MAKTYRPNMKSMKKAKLEDKEEEEEEHESIFDTVKYCLLILIIVAITVVYNHISDMFDIREEPILVNEISAKEISLIPEEVIFCNDSTWCSIEPPARSLYGFNTPILDMKKWKKSCHKAASGDQVLLREILKVFRHPYNFLDGDVSFKELQRRGDEFLDEEDGFRPLMKDPDKFKIPIPSKAQSRPKGYAHWFLKDKTKYFTSEKHLGMYCLIMIRTHTHSCTCI